MRRQKVRVVITNCSNFFNALSDSSRASPRSGSCPFTSFSIDLGTQFPVRIYLLLYAMHGRLFASTDPIKAALLFCFLHFLSPSLWCINATMKKIIKPVLYILNIIKCWRILKISFRRKIFWYENNNHRFDYRRITTTFYK